ncbi:hypothetical protein HK102_000804 [Quaeritorhiza haematococci]|nr:hypothetical protein HK102_000804 [Quaeritorhiza haematococci]
MGPGFNTPPLTPTTASPSQVYGTPVSTTPSSAPTLAGSPNTTPSSSSQGFNTSPLTPTTAQTGPRRGSQQGSPQGSSGSSTPGSQPQGSRRGSSERVRATNTGSVSPGETPQGSSERVRATNTGSVSPGETPATTGKTIDKFVSKLDEMIGNSDLSPFRRTLERMKMLISRLNPRQVDGGKWAAFEEELNQGILACATSNTKKNCKYPVLKVIMDNAEDLFGTWDYKYLFLSEIWNLLGLPSGKEWTKSLAARNQRKDNKVPATAKDTVITLSYWRENTIKETENDFEVYISPTNVVQASQLNADLKKHFENYLVKSQWDSFDKWDKIKAYNLAKGIDKN